MQYDEVMPASVFCHAAASGQFFWGLRLITKDLFSCGVLGYALAMGRYPWPLAASQCCMSMLVLRRARRCECR